MNNLAESTTNHLHSSNSYEQLLLDEIRELRIERIRLEFRLRELPRLRRLEQAVKTFAQADPAVRQILRLVEADGH